ncbi:DUF6458 family protein [Pseudonocardia humida]|uniref:DUF6458 domain-containing protein n=1 Tax=Pseudonocardia humida TaxID=2800819 RepID=A0ABT1A7G1_9PSEU|nr:DUF6458 family protein [Pseudonocardia humida]MCO1658769.1 hypothetical protein [Pseudonocardia humida]
MRIGSSIGLIAVGLVLALAVDDIISGVDLALVGWILAAVGVVGLVVSLSLMRRSRPAVEQPVVREQRVVREPTLHEQPVVREEYPQQRVERREQY